MSVLPCHPSRRPQDLSHTSYNLSLLALYLAFAVIIFYFSFAAVNAKLINDITAGIIRNPN